MTERDKRLKWTEFSSFVLFAISLFLEKGSSQFHFPFCSVSSLQSDSAMSKLQTQQGNTETQTRPFSN